MRTLLFLLITLPSAAFASDFTALYYYFTIQFLSYVWPFILPVFFLKGVANKARLYFVLLLLPFAMLELIDLPWQIYIGISAWTEFDPYTGISYYITGRHILALFISVALLPRFRKLLVPNSVQ